MARALLLLLGWLTAFPAVASSSGWIDTNAAEKMAADMRQQHMRLIGLDCRPDEASAGAERTSFLMEWEFNSDNRQWGWREATIPAVKGYKRDFAAKGFSLVIEKSFTMPSGKQRSCALWHRLVGKGPAAAPPPTHR